ncbi:Mix14p ASCRUDRAFT_16845, partial [Ascoidea rubescens DSM 1968]
MSGVLDQILLEDIARNCPQEFLDYHKCVSQNHKNGNASACVENQRKLTYCIKNNVPAFKKIQENCLGRLKDYEGCL